MKCEEIESPMGRAACYGKAYDSDHARGAEGPTSRREDLKGLGYEESRRRLSPDHAPGYEEQKRAFSPQPDGPMIAGNQTSDAELGGLLAKLNEMGIKVDPNGGEFVFQRTNVRYGPEMFATAARSILRGSSKGITGHNLQLILTSYFNYVSRHYWIPAEDSLADRRRNISPRKRGEEDSRAGIQALIDVGNNGGWIATAASVMGAVITVAVAGNLLGVVLCGGDLAMAGASFLQQLAKHGYGQVSDAFSASMGTGTMGPRQHNFFKNRLLKDKDHVMDFLQTKHSELGYASRMAINDIVQATY